MSKKNTFLLAIKKREKLTTRRQQSQTDGEANGNILLSEVTNVWFCTFMNI